MIGIIGYGIVGKAVKYGFPKTKSIICDPKYNHNTIIDVCNLKPKVIFICVPTPTDGDNYIILRNVLDEIKKSNYNGLVVVKSTILPKYIQGYDVIYNPEFLSRKTYKKDFVSPPFLIIGGNKKKTKKLLNFYKKYSIVDTKKVFLTDIPTASLVKYTLNSFYALKITFMNSIYDIAKNMKVDYFGLINILKENPWMGSHHFNVPGPDKKRGFGGPCLPKDTECFSKEFDNVLLKKVLKLNSKYRKRRV